MKILENETYRIKPVNNQKKTSTTIFKQFMEAKNDTTHKEILKLTQPTYNCNVCKLGGVIDDF